MASVATLSQTAWTKVKKHIGTTRYGCDRTQTQHLLDSFGCPHTYSMPRDVVTQFEWAVSHPRSRALLIVKGEDGSPDHAVVALNGVIHDPSKRNPYGPRPVTEVYLLTE